MPSVSVNIGGIHLSFAMKVSTILFFLQMFCGQCFSRALDIGFSERYWVSVLFLCNIAYEVG